MALISAASYYRVSLLLLSVLFKDDLSTSTPT